MLRLPKPWASHKSLYPTACPRPGTSFFPEASLAQIVTAAHRVPAILPGSPDTLPGSQWSSHCQTSCCLDGWMDGWLGGWVFGCMEGGLLDGWMDGWMNCWMDDWKDGLLDGWMKGWMSGYEVWHHIGGKSPDERAELSCCCYKLKLYVFVWTITKIIMEEARCWAESSKPLSCPFKTYLYRWICVDT